MSFSAPALLLPHPLLQLGALKLTGAHWNSQLDLQYCCELQCPSTPLTPSRGRGRRRLKSEEYGILVPFSAAVFSGSSWAESTTDAVGVVTVMASSASGGSVPQLSSNQVLSCSASTGACNGDYPTNALDYIAKKGLQTSAVYRGNVGTCNATSQGSVPPQIVMYEAVKYRSWVGLLVTLQATPVVTILDGSSAAFQAPVCTSRFVFADPSCNSGSLDHSVLVLGYDLTALTPYFLIRNSWGSKWCNSGYMRIAIQAGEGVCGMNVLPSYYPIPARE